MTKGIHIAVLLTCHNRRETTLRCLRVLYNQVMQDEVITEVFLVDDGCIDGTAKAVHEQFPQVNMIKGTGNLYWNQGMRLAWLTATKSKEYDYYLWLNDDTLLDKTALNELLADYNDARNADGKDAIIVGACRVTGNGSSKFSYGGRTEKGPVIPNGQIQKCTYINGNVVLIPKEIYRVLGSLSPDYTHIFGDYDYGLRAINAGFSSYTTKRFIAVCPTNTAAKWCDPDTTLLMRLRLMHSPKGLNLKEYIIFRKKHWGRRWLGYSLKAYLKALNPRVYFKTKDILSQFMSTHGNLKGD